MHASTSTILNVFLCSGLGAAQIIPHQPRGEMMEQPVARNAPAPATPVMADPAAAAAAEASGAPAAGGGAAPNAAGGTMNALCAQGTILAQGIALNIADQQQELTTANSLATILAANPVDTAAYGAARTDLLKFINDGIAIREMNQLITPQGNQATAGIATVANAQLTELGLANNLTVQGGDNVAGNMQIVQTLQMDFMGGIMQNMKNMAAAMAACGGMAAPAAAAPAAAPAPPQAQPAPAAGGAGGETAAPAQNATATSSSSSSGTKGSSGAKGSGGAKAGKFVTTKVGLQNERPNLVSRSAKFVV
ncbi:hypothetical protein LA080_006487 [Diaporthe eres]|uniref:Cell wall protein n=1 Tax=Diaporthe vaccinii TaxID=105482 RepID=A0ABR4EFH4_9PEZI|nr:hypothetical protein LA080_006487 [Diaporthe eres]